MTFVCEVSLASYDPLNHPFAWGSFEMKVFSLSEILSIVLIFFTEALAGSEVFRAGKCIDVCLVQI